MIDLKITIEKLFKWAMKQSPNILEDQKGFFRECKKFRYLGLKQIKRTDKKMVLRIHRSRTITAMLNGVLWNRQITIKDKLQMCNSVMKISVTYGAETWIFNKKIRIKPMSIQMDSLRRSARCSRLEEI